MITFALGCGPLLLAAGNRKDESVKVMIWKILRGKRREYGDEGEGRGAVARRSVQ